MGTAFVNKGSTDKRQATSYLALKVGLHSVVYMKYQTEAIDAPKLNERS